MDFGAGEDVGKEAPRGGFGERIGVLLETLSVREVASLPLGGIFRHVEDHFIVDSVRAVVGCRFESCDEEALDGAQSYDASGLLLPDAQVDKVDVFCEEVV